MFTYQSKVKCTCCDELLTKPIFIDGLAYGSHCSKKIKGVKSIPTFSIRFNVVAVSCKLRSIKYIRFNGKLHTITSSNDDFIDFKINTKDNKCALSLAIIQQATKERQPEESINGCLSNYFKLL